MKENLEIKPLVGFGEIKFGADMDAVKTVLGEPDEAEGLENDEDETDAIVWNYWNDGYSVFFDEGYDNLCTCFETDNEAALLFGKKVFEMKEAQVIELMKANGIVEVEAEDEAWGERRLTFNDAVMDFYFDNEQLVSVSWGVMTDDEDNVEWPK